MIKRGPHRKHTSFISGALSAVLATGARARSCVAPRRGARGADEETRPDPAGRSNQRVAQFVKPEGPAATAK